MTTPTQEDQPGSSKSLWIGVGLLFGLLLLAWTIMFTVASKSAVESVPLEHQTKP